MIRVVHKYKHTPSSNDVKIHRGFPLGNPYTSKELSNTKAEYQADSVDDSIQKYEAYLRLKISEKDKTICDELNRIYLKAKAGDVNLVCFCVPKKCHGDIIKAIVDEKVNKV